MDLNAVLARSKQVMNKTKNMPYGGYIEQTGVAVNNKNGKVMFEQRMSNIDGSPEFSENAASKSKLPKEIIDVIRESSSAQRSSVTDGIRLNEPKPQRNPYNVITEQINTPQPQPTQGTIDYSLIRMMIDESIKKYTNQLKKSILNESKTNGGLQMMTKQGNTFRFVTEDGKIFEAKMTYKGNINEK